MLATEALCATSVLVAILWLKTNLWVISCSENIPQLLEEVLVLVNTVFQTGSSSSAAVI